MKWYLFLFFFFELNIFSCVYWPFVIVFTTLCVLSPPLFLTPPDFLCLCVSMVSMYVSAPHACFAL